MKEVQNEQLFQELDNEVAATCSGGVAYLYQDDNFKGRKLTFYNYGTDLRTWDFNDKTSSLVIQGNEVWGFYRDRNYKGPSVALGSGTYTKSDLIAFGIPDNSISSLRRLA
jgi:hypothetical protein